MTEPNLEEKEAAWLAWANDPEHTPVRETALRLRPWKKYTMTSTGQRVSPVSFYEDSTIKVLIEANPEEPWRIFGFDVFGVDPNDLVELDPTPQP